MDRLGRPQLGRLPRLAAQRDSRAVVQLCRRRRDDGRGVGEAVEGGGAELWGPGQGRGGGGEGWEVGWGGEGGGGLDGGE